MARDDICPINAVLSRIEIGSRPHNVLYDISVSKLDKATVMKGTYCLVSTQDAHIPNSAIYRNAVLEKHIEEIMTLEWMGNGTASELA